jgi:hypothetical protein
MVAYMELLLARWECTDLGQSPREHPVPLCRLHELGIPDDILLWMLFHDHIEHLHTSPKRQRGTYRENRTPCQPAKSLTFTAESCFALNDRGAEFADAFLADALLPQFEGAFEDAWQKLIMGLLVPAYHRDERVFTWGEHVLKRFRQPAVNQELVLISAEELDWPEWFDDPLHRKNGHNPKTLLHDTIKDLNRRQSEWLIHFKGDGSGRRIGWELR